ncbi:MAG TPA: class A beta-lactamase [Caulobacteraceae bacterium]|nr:class A beta-lactamase [Caulobacteraceae bacterium]
MRLYIHRKHLIPLAAAAILIPALGLTIGRHGSAHNAEAAAPPALHERVPAPPAAPPELQAKIEDLAHRYGEKVGIAVMDVDKGWVAQVNGGDFFPQQSVSKTWVALSVLDAIDRGEMAFDQPVVMTQADRSVFFQPIARRIGKNGFQTDVADLLQRALTQSDNAANDMLIRLVGGAEAVMQTLDRKGLDGLRMDTDEKHLQAKVAGVPWNDNLVQGDRFRYLRSQLPDEVREQAMQRYVQDPYDGAQPVAIVQALGRLKRGQLLSTQNSQWMIETMMANTTGHSRLRAGAPRDWEIGDKTGTGQDWDGASVGINDIALMTAPDGRTYAVAVMIQRTKQGLEARRRFMQSVSRSVVEFWRDTGEAGQTAQASDRNRKG